MLQLNRLHTVTVTVSSCPYAQVQSHDKNHTVRWVICKLWIFKTKSQCYSLLEANIKLKEVSACSLFSLYKLISWSHIQPVTYLCWVQNQKSICEQVNKTVRIKGFKLFFAEPQVWGDEVVPCIANHDVVVV